MNEAFLDANLNKFKLKFLKKSEGSVERFENTMRLVGKLERAGYHVSNKKSKWSLEREFI